MKHSWAIFLAASLGFGGLAGQSNAQTAGHFPAQSVRVVSPFPAGSGPDVVARIVGDKLATSFKQGVLVETRSGANGFLATGAVKQAAPTGYDSVGGPLHLGAAQLEAASGTKMVRMPYKETSQLYAAVSTGEIDWALGSIASAD